MNIECAWPTDTVEHLLSLGWCTASVARLMSRSLRPFSLNRLLAGLHECLCSSLIRSIDSAPITSRCSGELEPQLRSHLAPIGTFAMRPTGTSGTGPMLRILGRVSFRKVDGARAPASVGPDCSETHAHRRGVFLMRPYDSAPNA